MKVRFAAATMAALAAGLLVCAVAGAAMVGIYRNGLETTPQRAELIKLFGRSCKRGGGEDAIRVLLGAKTDSCAYRTPVIGRDLEIAATERILSGTPKALQRKAYVAIQLRAGGGNKYELRAFPMQRKAQLLKVSEAGTKYLAIQKNLKAIGGINEPTVVRLRVEKAAGDASAAIAAFVGPEVVGEVTDEAAGEVSGEFTAASVGANKIAEGLVGSIDDLVVRVPVTF
ncbi:MAG TPA: hypothetical protein VEB65_05725 [Solirubrobacterales bacterium]|nr:hypothetical protein [Solirubrobacterales bacterium]